MAESLSSSHPRLDPIVGLDFSGKKFYSHISTLRNGSHYFASRFNTESNLQPGDYLGKDEFGRDVYFVDRSGKLFSFILEFLRNNTVDIPPYQENPSLWKSLRREALFFGVDGLISLLQVTYSCSPSPGVPKGDCGVLYYLGTNNGRSETYQNPYMVGKLNVTGSVDESDPFGERDIMMNRTNSLFGQCTNRTHRKAGFVHYRQPVDCSSGVHLSVNASALDECEGNIGKFIIIDMRGVQVRPSHYSLRGTDCRNLTSDWTLEGSYDSAVWKCLHQGTNESYIEQLCGGTRDELSGWLGVDSDHPFDLSVEQRAYLTDRAEELLRGTWAVPEYRSFYRFFRIRKTSDGGCMHVTSFEIFGDVNECPDE